MLMQYYNKYLYQTMRILSIVILGQTLFFKYSGAKESVYIFQSLGMEPWGRIGTAILETVAILLLMFPNFVWLGAGIVINLMLGAILSHIMFLGIAVNGDGGLLFILAIIVFISSLYLGYCDFYKSPLLRIISKNR